MNARASTRRNVPKSSTKIIHALTLARARYMHASTATRAAAAPRTAHKTRRTTPTRATGAVARARRASPRAVARLVVTASSSSSGRAARTRAAGSDDDATATEDEVPIWERREIERKAAADKGGLPWPVYLLGSVIVLIASTGSVFEYAYKNPIFGVVNADSGLYAPILGWFVFTGFPLAGWLWKKGIDGANEASELQDKIDGY